MKVALILDMGAGVMVSLIGIWGLVLWGLPAFAIEAGILSLVLPKERAIRDSLAMNLVSTAAGFVASAFLITSLQSWAVAFFRPELESWEISTVLYNEIGIHTTASFLGLILLLWLLSLLIEGAILQLLERRLPKSELWLLAAIANTASYVVPAIYTVIWVSQNSTG